MTLNYRNSSPAKSKWVLVLIGIEKLTKAALLILLARQVHRLILSPNAAETLQGWVHQIRVDPGNRHIHGLISRVTGMSHRRLWEISLGSYLYASLYIVEGGGLIMHERWAEWLTACATAIFIPMELFELFRANHHALKLIALAINVAIVIYLFARLRREVTRVQRSETCPPTPDVPLDYDAAPPPNDDLNAPTVASAPDAPVDYEVASPASDDLGALAAAVGRFPPNRNRASLPDRGELGVIEWTLILLPGFCLAAFAVGIMRWYGGKRSGGRMMRLSLLASFVWYTFISLGLRISKTR